MTEDGDAQIIEELFDENQRLREDLRLANEACANHFGAQERALDVLRLYLNAPIAFRADVDEADARARAILRAAGRLDG